MDPSLAGNSSNFLAGQVPPPPLCPLSWRFPAFLLLMRRCSLNTLDVNSVLIAYDIFSCCVIQPVSTFLAVFTEQKSLILIWANSTYSPLEGLQCVTVTRHHSKPGLPASSDLREVEGLRLPSIVH